MRFLHALIVLGSIAAASLPAAAQTQDRYTEQDLTRIDAYLAQTEGLLDGSYLFVGYSSEEDGEIEIILPKEQVAEMIAGQVLTGEVPPDTIQKLVQALVTKTRRHAQEWAMRKQKILVRRAQIVEAIGRDNAPANVVQADPPPPPPRASLIERARAAAAGSPISRGGGAVTAGAMPGSRAAAPAEAPVDGSIAVPLLPEPSASDGFAPSPFTDWMSGTFDNDRNVFTLNRGSGSYLYANGTMTAERIDGTVVEGRWTQSSSGQQCQDGGYHGRFRITFTEDGFSGLFGYCDEPPGAPGGFQGKRRR